MAETHAGSGSFRVDEEAMRRKLEKEREKLWSHRATVIASELWGYAVGGSISMSAAITAGYFSYQAAQNAGLAILGALICFAISVGACFLTATVLEEPISRIRSRWNP